MGNNSEKVWYKHKDGSKKLMYLHLLEVANRSGYILEDPRYDAAGNLKVLKEEKAIPESKADVVGEKKVPKAEEIVPEPEDVPDLTKVKIDLTTKKFTDLREIAKNKGITIPFGTKKADLIDLIENNG